MLSGAAPRQNAQSKQTGRGVMLQRSREILEMAPGEVRPLN